MPRVSKKKVIITISAILGLALIGVIYVNIVLLPVKIKKFIIERAESALQRKVSFDSIKYIPVKGVIIENIVITGKTSDPPMFLSLKELSFNVLLPPILTNKHIIITSLRLDSPVVTIKKYQDQSWNFSDLIKPRSDGTKNPYSFFLRKISLENGQVRVSDANSQNLNDTKITDINLQASLGLDRTVPYSVTFRIPEDRTSFQATGTVVPENMSITAKVITDNLIFSKYAALIKEKIPLDLSQGSLTIADITLDLTPDDFQFSGRLKLNNLLIKQPDTFEVSGNFSAENINARWSKKNLTVTGNYTSSPILLKLPQSKEFAGNLNTQIRSLTLEGGNLSFKGAINADHSSLKLDENRTIQGSFQSDDISLTKNNGSLTIGGQWALNGSKMIFGPDILITGELSSSLFQLSRDGETTTVTGNYRMNDAGLRIGEDKSLNTQLTATETNLKLEESGVTFTGNFKLSQTQASFPPNRKLKSDIVVEKAQLTLANQLLNFQGHLDLNDSLIDIDSDKKLRGTITSQIKYSYDLKDKISLYSGDASLSQIFLSGLPQAKELSIADGKVSFNENSVRTEGLGLKLLDTECIISGSLTDFRHPYADIRLRSPAINLSLIKTLAPQVVSAVDTDIAGKAAVDMTFKGLVSSPKTAEVNVKAEFTDTNISSGKFNQSVQNLSGKVNLEKNKITWQGLTATYQGKNYTLNGALEDFTSPKITAKLTGDNVSLDAQVQIDQQNINLSQLTGKYYKSTFNIKGSAIFKDGQPDLDLSGDVMINLDDLSSLSPSMKEKLDPLQLKGKIDATAFLKGNPKNWPRWQLSIRAASPSVSVMKTTLQNLQFNYSQRDQKINLGQLTADIYGGTINVASTADLRQDPFPAQFDIKLDNMELAQMREEKKLKYKDLAGSVTVHSTLSGPLKNIKSIHGYGSLGITDGNLWQWNILEGILKALVIPEFQNVTFNSAQATFSVENEKVSTQNLEIFGNTVNLAAKGSVDFNRNLNFDVSPKFSEITLTKSESIKKAPTSLITQAIMIHLTGTLEKPHFKVDSSPLKVIENTTDVIKEGIKSILGDIF